MARHHVIISGTGRTGTTFLVQLLTELHLDTGFETSNSGIFENCNAGMEKSLGQPDAPYIVKSPFLCDQLDEIIHTGQVVIDHAIVPMRDLYSAAESRRDVVRRFGPSLPPDSVPGGLWHTRNPSDQEAILTRELYNLVYTIAEHDIPVTFLLFPRLVKEPDYLYKKISPLLPGIEHGVFLRAFEAVSQPALVHDFRQQERAVASAGAALTEEESE